jgi:hypothetical protein
MTTRSYSVTIAIFWTLAILTSLLSNIKQESEEKEKMARESARTNFYKDTVYRRWASSHGGVYVPVSEHTQPNPYLEVEEQEITTPSGRLLIKVKSCSGEGSTFSLYLPGIIPERGEGRIDSEA